MTPCASREPCVHSAHACDFWDSGTGPEVFFLYLQFVEAVVRCKYVVWPCGDSEHGAGRRLSLSASPHVAKLDVDGVGVGISIGVLLLK